jgi:lysophospholipase L1-like esterase
MLRTYLAFPLWILLIGSMVPATAAEPLLKSGDRLALVGGTFIERMQATAALENQLYPRRPDWKLRVRNLGWSGDNVHGFARKVFETDPQHGFDRLMSDLKIADPTVALVAYGFSEAAGGESSVAAFESGLRKLVDALAEMNCRVILMKPLVVPGVRVEGYAEQISRSRQAIDLVAKETGAEVVDVSCDDWTDDRLVPSEEGYEQIGQQLADTLVGGEPVHVRNEELESLIVKKNQQFFHRHRPQNETYLLLFRKHEQGNNAVELPQFDPVVDELDRQIWAEAAAGN